MECRSGRVRPKRAAAVLAVLCLLLIPVCVRAYEPVKGIIKDGPVKVRTAPVDGEKAALLEAGAAVTVLGEERDCADGKMWYQISAAVGSKEVTGYVREDFVTLSGDGADAGADSYAAELQKAGFPADYCGALAALHQKYPSWSFVPVQTGLDWNTAVENESETGKNLVQSVANDARKATDDAAYDWKKNKWYGFDGAGWVCASPEFIAYCMDPRNFLNEKAIFQFETLEFAPYQDADGVKNILAGTFMAGNYTDTDGAVRSYADTFVEIGAMLAVSPYHLASRCRQEQGVKGKGDLISGRFSAYAGYYNYFNVRAYTTSAASATVNGLAYAKQQGWDSIYKAILGGSDVVANNYVKKGQNTIYFEKFNVVYKKSLYSHQYMTNVMAAVSEGSSMGAAYTDKNQAFVFCIPVYENMPAQPAAFADSGNPNNWLSSLKIEGQELTPGFDGAVTSYSLVVPADTASIDVKAKAVADTSKVAGAGDYALNYGNNTIQVVCTSQSGADRTYTITVARQQPDGGVPEDGAPEGEAPAGGEPGAGGETPAVMYGDINGDGKISNVDLVLLQKQILGIEELKEERLLAADVNRDGSISNMDLVMLQKHILNIEQIRQ